MMDGTREIEGAGDDQAIKRDAFTEALVYAEGDQARAVAMGRISHGFTGATMIAAAIFDVPAFNPPVSVCHSCLPNFFVGLPPEFLRWYRFWLWRGDARMGFLEVAALQGLRHGWRLTHQLYS